MEKIFEGKTKTKIVIHKMVKEEKKENVKKFCLQTYYTCVIFDKSATRFSPRGTPAGVFRFTI